MDKLSDWGMWGSNLVEKASEAASVGAAAAAGFAAKGAKAAKSALKENLNSFTAETHNFQGGLSVITVCRLAEGAFGEVMKCRDQRTGQDYALKIINCQEGVQVASTLKAAELEAKVLRSLPPHPNIIRCIGYSVDKVQGTGTAVVKLVLELCPGGTLLDYMDSKNGKLGAKEILDPLAQISEAVRHMHAQRPPIQHRDLKVENVLKGADGRWKLCDFGSCSTQSVPAQEMSRAQIMALQEDIDKTVTMLYRPPEMVDLELNHRTGYAITEQVDLWMIGCILFTLAFYIHPFQDNASAAGIQNARFFIPTDHAMAKSPKLCALVHWLLAPDPNDRPTCDRLCEVIKNLPSTKYEDMFASLPPSVQAKQRKFAEGQSRRPQGSSLDDEITPEMAKALAAGKGRPAARRPRGESGADSPPSFSPTERSQPQARPAQRQQPAADAGFDLAFALAGDAPAAPAAAPAATPAAASHMEDLLGFTGGGAAPPAPQAAHRGKSAPAPAHDDLLAFVGDSSPSAPAAPAAPSRHTSAPVIHQGDLLGFGAPMPAQQQPAAQMQPQAGGGSFWATDFADFSAGPPAPQAPVAAPVVAAKPAGGDLLGFDDFADFSSAPQSKANGSTMPAAAPASGNLLDF